MDRADGLAILAWLGGRWALGVLALPPVALELYHGNIHLLLAAAIALSFRFPWTWSFVILTKVTAGVGVLWFAVRREWRSFVIALGVTAVICAVTLVIEPSYWAEFFRSIQSNLTEPQYFSIPPPWPIRVPLAIVLVIWGARTDRPWTVAIAATLGLPIIWPHGLTVALAAIPFLRRGDRAALTPNWQSAADWRRLALSVGVIVGGALALALVVPDRVRGLMDWASSGLNPYNR